MKLWFPSIQAGSGADQYVRLLARGLEKRGHSAQITWFPHRYELLPAILAKSNLPRNIDLIHTNSWHGLRFSHPRLVTTVHNCVHDPIFAPFRSLAQALYHRWHIRPREAASINCARQVFCISHYTGQVTRAEFPTCKPSVILNGIDTSFFTPGQAGRSVKKPFRLLFVGNPSRRKGFDLLPAIMIELGRNFELYYTGTERSLADNMFALGKLSLQGVLEQYRLCDALLFPTRYEGFGYVAAEAMACGKPVISSQTTALPEVVKHGETGFLCPVDDIQAFVNAARVLRDSPELAQQQGEAGRQMVLEQFNLTRMIDEYIAAYESVLSE